MSTSTIVLESYQPGDLRQCQPNLMPFHISYNGPALISTFMDVKPAKEDSAKAPSTGPTTTKAGSDVNSGEAQDAATEGPAKADAEVAEDAMRVDEPTTTNIEKEAGPDSSMSNQPQTPTAQQAARFTSSFRGRVIQGLDVDIPQGYRGVVLRGPASDAPPTTASAPTKAAASSSKSKAKSKASAVTQTAVDEEDDAPGPSTRRRGRLTRSAVSKKKIVVEEEEEVEEEVKETAAVAEVAIDVDAEGTAQTAATTTTAAGDAELTAQRRLKPVGEFSKFTLWHPDNPVVENQDEYYRSLNEWTVLAAALHQGDDEDP